MSRSSGRQTPASPNSSGSAEQPPEPWLYPYQEDGPRLDLIVQRPVVPVALVGTDVSAPVYALVDSGCSHILAAPWVADAAGVDARRFDRQLKLGIGGGIAEVRFADVRVRLLGPQGSGDEVFVEWEAEVGFLKEWKPTWPVLLGQIGFLDQFTVTTSLHAHWTAVADVGEFDRRYGIPVAPSS